MLLMLDLEGNLRDPDPLWLCMALEHALERGRILSGQYLAMSFQEASIPWKRMLEIFGLSILDFPHSRQHYWARSLHFCYNDVLASTRAPPLRKHRCFLYVPASPFCYLLILYMWLVQKMDIADLVSSEESPYSVTYLTDLVSSEEPSCPVICPTDPYRNPQVSKPKQRRCAVVSSHRSIYSLIDI